MFFLIKINFAGLLGFRVPIATFTPQSACISSERTVSTNYTMTRHNYPKRIFPLAEATARIAFIAYRFDCSKYVLVLPYGISNNAFHTFVGIQFLEDSA
jgi:hypothetical protein